MSYRMSHSRPRRTESTGNQVVIGYRAVVLIAFLVCGQSVLAEPQPDLAPPSVERALSLLKQGGDGREVVAMLEALALANEGRAQYMLGALYFEGRGVPRDQARSYAWFDVAAQYAEPPVREQAVQTRAALAQSLTGAELIRAEQMAAELRTRLVKDQVDAVRAYTSEPLRNTEPPFAFVADVVQLAVPSASQPSPIFHIGCGAEFGKNCPSESRASGPRCTGHLVRADVPPTVQKADRRYVVQPGMPDRLKGHGSGTTKVLAHVDSSGWICSFVLATRSGYPDWDEAVIKAVRLWRYSPAQAHGEPVESLFPFAVAFRNQ